MIKSGRTEGQKTIKTYKTRRLLAGKDVRLPRSFATKGYVMGPSQTMIASHAIRREDLTIPPIDIKELSAKRGRPYIKAETRQVAEQETEQQKDEEVDEQHTRDLIEKSTEATRAQNDARFAEVLSEMRSQGAELRAQGEALSAAIKSQGETLSAELREVRTEIRSVEDRMVTSKQFHGGLITTGLLLAALMVAVLTLASGTFNTGMSLSPLAAQVDANSAAVEANTTAIEENRLLIQSNSDKLDTILERLPAN